MKVVMIASDNYIFGGGRIHPTTNCSLYKQDFSFDLPMTYNFVISMQKISMYSCMIKMPGWPKFSKLGHKAKNLLCGSGAKRRCPMATLRQFSR